MNRIHLGSIHRSCDHWFGHVAFWIVVKSQHQNAKCWRSINILFINTFEEDKTIQPAKFKHFSWIAFVQEFFKLKFHIWKCLNQIVWSFIRLRSSTDWLFLLSQYYLQFLSSRFPEYLTRMMVFLLISTDFWQIILKEEFNPWILKIKTV